MKLAIFIYSLSGGGAERVVSYLLLYFVKNNIQVSLICMNTMVSYEIPDGLEIYYIEKSKHDENGLFKAFKIPILAYRYSRLMKKLRITHSISFLTRPNFVNILSSKLTQHKYKVITNERAFPSLQYGYKGFQSKFNKKMITLLYNKSDLIIANSYGNAEDLVNNFGVSPEKMKIVHNPIHLEKINEIDPIKSYFDKNKFNMITVGRLTTGKNFALIINAIYKLKNPLLKLYIIGDGSLYGQLENLINNLKLNDQIVLMGFDSNPYKYLKSADLFVFGSNHEGFPNVLLEAMSCGIPVLSTNCKSGPSEIMELKELKNDIMITNYGILTPTNNVDLMAKGINYFVQNDEYLMRCRDNVKKRIQDFKKEKVLKEYMEIINPNT
jgi:N-acetylgalactosamine-N,N'-diacetylbacillosaminyl-diphospho-undecaprenol 4-alpha-N-acetylgalactosaminyltransferase